jgi:hypothetical protein
MVRRKARAEGHGPLARATAQEFGVHEVVPGGGGEPRIFYKGQDRSGWMRELDSQTLTVPLVISDATVIEA